MAGFSEELGDMLSQEEASGTAAVSEEDTWSALITGVCAYIACIRRQWAVHITIHVYMVKMMHKHIVLFVHR